MKKLKWSVGKGELTVILFIGLLFGWLVTTMILSGTGNIKQFYDSGKIYDIDYEGRMQDFEGISYNVSEGRYNISGDTAVLYYNLRDSFQKWNHVYLTLKNVNQKSVATQIEYYLDGVLLETQNIVLTEGKNYINATGNIYNGMAIRIQNQQGTSFTVAKLQFREREQFLSGKKFSLIFFPSLIGFVILAVIFVTCLKNKGADWYSLIEIMQKIWIVTGESLGKEFYSLSVKKRKRIRIILLTAMMLVMSILENFVYLHSKPYYGITMLFISIIISVISFVSIETNLKKLNWRNSLTASWLALWIMAIISDFIVDKRYQYQGFIMLFIVGFFFFVWGNMKNPIEMLHDLMRAGEYVFWITMLFMYFCRPVSDDIRYSGFFRNPNIEAAFASAAFILFLVELDNCILQKKIDGKCVFYCVGIILAFDRVNRSDGRTGQLALIAAFLFFCIHNLHYVRKNHTFRSGIMIFLLCSFLFIPISETNNWLLHNLADKFGTEVVYPTDQNYLTAGIRNETIVYAEEINDTELVLEEELNNKLEGRREVATLVSSASLGNALEAYSSGRTLYYLAYIRQMNLFGHYYHAKNWGDYIYPHNGLLEIMYRYGIFSAVPYVIMMISSFWRALLYATGKNSRKRYKLYPILITIGAGCTFLLENGEKPFVWLIWILFYLGQGILFTEDRYRKRMLYEGGKSHGAE